MILTSFMQRVMAAEGMRSRAAGVLVVGPLGN